MTRFEQTTVMWCDGSPQSRRAVPASTLEAAARGTGLVLLVVTGSGPGGREGRPPAQDPVADQAVAAAVATNPSVPLEVLQASASARGQLTDLARRTSLLVMGAARREDGSVWPAGAVFDALVAHLDCPVLFVDGHDLSAAESAVGHEPAVVAGIDMLQAPEPVLLTAAVEAVVRGVGLTLVHALDRSATLDPGALARGWDRCRASLRSAGLPRGVPNRLVVSQEDPVAALRNRVGPRDLLVLGTGAEGVDGGAGADTTDGTGSHPDRRGDRTDGGRGWARGHLGPVGRALLAAMPCDVLLVPPWPPSTTVVDLVARRVDRAHIQSDAVG